MNYLPRLSALLAVALVTWSAAANAAPCSDAPQLDACKGKKAGDVCTLSSGAAGTCAALKCTDDAGATLLGCAEAPPAATSSDDGGCNVGANGKAGGSCLFGLALLGLAVRARASRRASARAS